MVVKTNSVIKFSNVLDFLILLSTLPKTLACVYLTWQRLLRSKSNVSAQQTVATSTSTTHSLCLAVVAAPTTPSSKLSGLPLAACPAYRSPLWLQAMASITASFIAGFMNCPNWHLRVQIGPMGGPLRGRIATARGCFEMRHPQSQRASRR